MICEVAAARGGSGGGRELLHTVKVTDHAVKVTDQAAVAGGRGSCCTPEKTRATEGRRYPRTILLLLLPYTESKGSNSNIQPQV
jgi:hypothetical protein